MLQKNLSLHLNISLYKGLRKHYLENLCLPKFLSIAGCFPRFLNFVNGTNRAKHLNRFLP